MKYLKVGNRYYKQYADGRKVHVSKVIYDKHSLTRSSARKRRSRTRKRRTRKRSSARKRRSRKRKRRSRGGYIEDADADNFINHVMDSFLNFVESGAVVKILDIVNPALQEGNLDKYETITFGDIIGGPHANRMLITVGGNEYTMWDDLHTLRENLEKIHAANYRIKEESDIRRSVMDF